MSLYIINWDKYIRQDISPYLLNTNNYEHILEKVTQDYMNKSIEDFLNFINQKGNKLLASNMIYLKRKIE